MRGTGNWIKSGVVAIMLALGSPAALASGEHEGGHGDASGGEADNSGSGHGHDGGHAMMSFEFGEAVSAGEADRTIEIVARDNMRFEPSRIAVEAGETVTFRVRNAGKLQHSFTLGTNGYHKRHDREMMDMPTDEFAHHMDDSPNGMVVRPGQIDSLTWQFDESGPIQFACHIPGHYPNGMAGRLDIEERDSVID